MSTSIWRAAGWLCLLVVLSACAAPRPRDAGTIQSQVDAAAREWLASTGAPSVSVAIVRDAQLFYVRAYGRARLAPPMHATVDTHYAIDSVSKEFTAAALLLLAEQRKLSLDDPLSTWFPDLGAAATVTLRQLLSHTGGLRDFWPQDFVTPEMAHPTTTAAIIDEWGRRPLDFEPGTDWQYSNTGYVLAGAVVERVAGQSLYEFLRERIFVPLHMAGVTEDDTGPLPVSDAGAYTRFGLGPVQPAPKEGAGWLFGAAELAMRPTDLALWDISLIERSLLQGESYEAELAPVVLRNGSRRNYGLGLDVEEKAGRLRIGHAGGGSGFLAENRIWPHDRTAIVVLTNNDWASPDDLLERIAFAVLPPTPAESRARTVFDGMQHGTLDRTLFNDIGNSYLTAAALQELRASLGPLGPARLIALEGESRRGGMLTRRWKILCQGGRLEAIERGHESGKLEEFSVRKRED